MEYINNVVQNFYNMEAFFRMWLHAAGAYIILGLAVDLYGLFFFEE